MISKSSLNVGRSLSIDAMTIIRSIFIASVFDPLRTCETRSFHFFQENQLRTARREDFKKFVRVLELIGERKHLNSKGIMEIAKIAQTMNRRKPSRFLESSETTRQASSKKKMKI